MASLSNGYGRTYPIHISTVSVLIPDLSPSSKSRSSASPDSFSLGGVFLTNQRRRSHLISHLILLPPLSYSQQLNAINVNFFTPCLLFSKVAFFLSPGPPSSPSICPIAHVSFQRNCENYGSFPSSSCSSVAPH